MRGNGYPGLEHETRLWSAGYTAIAGLDEAGRGALAGPVVAGAVVLPTGVGLDGIWAQVRDSKLLSPAKREGMVDAIHQSAAGWAVGEASAQEIDAMGIAPATRLAMQRAIEALPNRADYLLLDWVRLHRVNLPQESFTKGDRHVVSIAAASILAKVHRDRLLVALDGLHPAYGFASHKGYGAASHLAAIERLGPCPAHRMSFAPMRRDASLFTLD
ncbi:MAG: ribonuclease HII [Caldilineaceae bacterium]|nr:ribonuclease HII [Caldilineaceae bacterium]